MNEWKWSNGEPYEKSKRPDSQIKYEVNYDTGLNAINQSLQDDYDMINITNSIFSRNQNQSNTFREELDSKIADRELMCQRGTNPFAAQTSYVNDIIVRDMFLKPINTTTTEKAKPEQHELR